MLVFPVGSIAKRFSALRAGHLVRTVKNFLFPLGEFARVLAHLVTLNIRRSHAVIFTIYQDMIFAFTALNGSFFYGHCKIQMTLVKGLIAADT